MIEIYPASWSVLKKIYVKHRIQWKEIEEVFDIKPKIYKIKSKDQYRETRYKALGITHGGRYLIIVFARDYEKNIKVITSREMDKAEKKQYKGR